MEESFITLMEKYVFNEQYKKGYSFNAYGNTEKVEERIRASLDEKFPMDENGKRKTFHNNVFLYEINPKEEWGQHKTVLERYWTVWGPMLKELCEILRNSEEAGGKIEALDENLKLSLEGCFRIFGKKSVSELATIHNKADTMWTGLKNILKILGIQIVIIFHDFDKVASVFPKKDKLNLTFYRGLYKMSTKSHSGNTEKIIIVSESECAKYEVPNSGSSLRDAYRPILCK